MISSCRRAISMLFSAFSIFIALHFNLHLSEFTKCHYLIEVNKRQTIFFEIKCLELYQSCHAMHMVVNFLGVHLESKHLRQNKKKLSF